MRMVAGLEGLAEKHFVDTGVTTVQYDLDDLMWCFD